MDEAAHELLERLSADNHALLYRCRWSQERADDVVPQLTRLLSHRNASIHQEALRALHRIGPAAVAAAPAIARLTQHADLLTRRCAVGALGSVALEDPSVAIQHLIAAIGDGQTVVDALHSIIPLGSGAAEALPAVIQAYGSPKARIRRTT